MLDASDKSDSSIRSSNVSTAKIERPSLARKTRGADFVRRLRSLPKRTIWKDKGGSARYVLRNEPPPESKLTGLGAAAKERLTDAMLQGSLAGLCVLERVESAAVATRKVLDRQLSQKGLSGTGNPIESSEEGSEAPLSRRGLLRRAKSLGSAKPGGITLRRSRRDATEPSSLTSTAA